MVDPFGVEGDGHGLDLLPLETRFEREKVLRHTRAHFSQLSAPWSALANISFDGYEIRHGRARLASASDDATIALRNDSGDAIGWQKESVLGIYAHGLFESPATMRGLFGAEPRALDSVFEGLADFIHPRFESGVLMSLVGRAG